MYINGIGVILPSIISDGAYTYGKVVEPEYDEFISPNQLRRMSRIMRMGLWAGKKALYDANITTPDAIITATALGANEDTEKFMRSFTEGSATGSPTSFIQSTHNVLGGQLALALSCTGYNMTYTQRGFSFESALLDSQLLISETGGNILCGAADELTPLILDLHRKMRVKGSNITDGEAFAFFVLSSNPKPNCYAVVKDIVMESSNSILFKEKWQEVFKVRNATSENTLVLCGDESDIYTIEIPEHFKIKQLIKDSGYLSIFSAYAFHEAAKILNDPTNLTYTSVAILRQDNQQYFRLIFLQKLGK